MAENFATEKQFVIPHRAEVWLVVDKNVDHNGPISERKYENSVQGGTRTCVIVSNNTGNLHSPNVEIVYTTTKKKADLPTHFLTRATPRPSTVLCEGITTISKTDLVKCYGSLSDEERVQLDCCLKISIGLK